MIYLAYATALAAAAQFFSDLYRSFDVDVMEGDLFPRRWVVWGTCLPLSGRSEHTFRYFAMLLPFTKPVMALDMDVEVRGQLRIIWFADKWRYCWSRP
jgi:hypothetical protein